MRPRNRWRGGLLGGIVGALGFGALIWGLTPEMIRTAIPALYGLGPTAVGGWLIHLLHGAIFGVGFAALVENDAAAAVVSSEPVLSSLDVATRMTVAGAAYSLAIWAIFPVVVMPLWLERVGFADVPPFPNVAVALFASHLVYGLILGAVYAVVVDR